MATIHKNLVDIARDKAIDNAQRNAVEKAVGVMITSTTAVENYQVKLDQILSESKGFINSYRILSEMREGDAYKVVLEADVGIGKLKDRMAAVDLIMTRKSKPRVMIVMADDAQKDAIAEAAMTKYFLSQGFRLVDAGKARTGRIQERLQTAALDSREVADIAHRYGAEVIILGRVETTAKSFRMGDVEVQSYEVAVSGKVINGDTGEVIATDTKTGKGEVKTVTEQAASDLARRMNEDILEKWSAELANSATVTLLVSGLDSYEDLLRFKEILSAEVKGFKDVFQRSYTQGRAELDVEIEGNAQTLADDLAAITMNERKVKILEITQNRVAAQLLP